MNKKFVYQVGDNKKVQTNSVEQNPLGKLAVSYLTKKFSAFSTCLQQITDRLIWKLPRMSANSSVRSLTQASESCHRVSFSDSVNP